MSDLVLKGRDLRGPRSMAYYAIVDALAETLKDRPSLLIDLNNFRFRTETLIGMYSREFEFSGSMPYDPEKGSSKGFVKATKKADKGVEIEFKQTKYTYPELSCRDTRKPIRIRTDGSIEYEQYCVETGKMLTQDTTPQPTAIHPLLAAGVAPGTYTVVTSGPVVAFTKKKATDKKIVTFFGFSL